MILEGAVAAILRSRLRAGLNEDDTHELAHRAWSVTSRRAGRNREPVTFSKGQRTVLELDLQFAFEHVADVSAFGEPARLARFYADQPE